MTWRFVVDEGVEPAPDCLERLQAARARVPDAVLVAARVVLPDGSLDPASEPMPRILDKQEAVDAARERLLAIRAARPGAMLVRGDGEADLAGTAALLAGARGVLAPEAVAVRTAPKAREPLRARLRLLREPHWTREERLLGLFAALRRP
jgi:predicted component of type VI protein secretion system